MSEPEDIIDLYVTFVKSKVDFIEEKLSSFSKIDVSLADIKEIYKKRFNVLQALNAEYQRHRILLKAKKRSYTVWYNDKYHSTRLQLNPIDLPGAKWSSKHDIDAKLTTNNKEEFLKFNEEIDFLESKVSFLKSLVDDWRTIQMDLSNLTKIALAEMSELGALDKANKQVENGSIPRREKRSV